MIASNAPFLPTSYHSLVSAPLADNFSSLKYPSHYSLTYHPLPPTTFLSTNYHFLASALLTAHSSHHNSLKILLFTYHPLPPTTFLPKNYHFLDSAPLTCKFILPHPPPSPYYCLLPTLLLPSNCIPNAVHSYSRNPFLPLSLFFIYRLFFSSFSFIQTFLPGVIYFQKY